MVLFIDRALGLLEAAALTKLVRQVRPDVRIVANDGLIPFTGLRSLLIPPEAIRASLENDEALIVGGNLPVAPEAKAPLLPLRLFRSRNFSAANIETFAVYGGLSAWGFFLSLYLQQIAGYSPFQAGLATVPLTIGMFLLSRYFGRMSMRFGPRLFMAAGPLVGAVSILALARLPTHPNYWIDLFPPLVGFAVALCGRWRRCSAGCSSTPSSPSERRPTARSTCT